MRSQRQLRGKIQSIRNIKQITKAMQMVAATKMRKSQEVALEARPYARYALSLLSRILERAEREERPLPPLAQPGEGKVCFVVVTSDRGLAGSYNSNVLRAAWSAVRETEAAGKTVEVAAVGRKAESFFLRRGTPVAASFTKFSDIVSIHDITPLASWVLERYRAGEYEQVSFVSTHFLSALRQEVNVLQVLPLEPSQLRAVVEGILPATGKYSGTPEEFQEGGDALFEPSLEALAEQLSWDLARVQIAHLIFESNAAEHSSRMIAMKNATDNAQNLQEELTLELNKARQAAITQELSEISGAKEALTNE